MITFIVSLIALLLGYLLYGRLVEKIFGAEPERTTPALSMTDGVDYVPLPAWRIFLIQFLNIAGLGPIFGAIMGIFYGPAAFLWIVLGSIFAGGVHDYMSGMLSIRKEGASLPEIVGSELGTAIRQFMRLLSIVLLVLLTTNFMTSPATLLAKLCSGGASELLTDSFFWLIIIFLYYALATVLPIDKLIGRFYPIFGGLLLFMGAGIAIVMLGQHAADMPELSDGLANRQTNGLPLFPMMFVSIACGAISGFHGTQSPLMARCCTTERQGRHIFYGAMIVEGVLALIWAAAAGSFRFPDAAGNACLTIQEFAAIHQGENIAALVVNEVSRTWLGRIGGIIAVVGVISASITSGDTALRSARLIVADFLHLEQRTIWKRLVISVPMFAIVFGMSFVDFNIVWRYFSWTNQTLAVFTLWAATIYLYRRNFPADTSSYLSSPNSSADTSSLSAAALASTDLFQRYGYIVTLLPALFMTVVSVSYILIAPEGFHLPESLRWIGYMAAVAVSITLLLLFCYWTKKLQKA